MARSLVLEDLMPSVAAVPNPGRKVERAAPGAVRWADDVPVRGLTLNDLAPAEPEKPIIEEPFDGNDNTLQLTVPLPGNWPTVDTGVSIGKHTGQVLGGAGKRFHDLKRGAQQKIDAPAIWLEEQFPAVSKWAEAIGFPSAVQSAKLNQADIDESYEQDKPLMSTLGGIVGNALPDIIAGARIPAARVGQSVRMGAAQGFLQPTTSSERNGAAVNTAAGAIAGGLGHLGAKALSNLGGKAIHALPELIPNKVREAVARMGAKLPETIWADPEQRRLYQLAKAKGVPTTIGDIDPTSGWAGVENANRNFWTGRSADMQTQQDATRKVLTDLEGGLTSGVPGEEGGRIATGIKEAYGAAKKAASDKFKRVSDIAGRSPGLTPVKPVQTKQAVDSAVADYPDLFTEFQNSPTIRKMIGLAEDVGDQPGRILQPDTLKPFKYTQELGFDDAQFLRKRLGAWYDKLATQHQNGTLPAGLDGEAVKHAASIFSAFNKDLDAWGTQEGNKALNTAWKDARGYFKDNVLPYRDPSKLASKSPLIRNIVNDGVDAETIVSKALPTHNSSIADDIMELGNADAQAAMKSALARKLVDPSISSDLQGLGNSSLLRNTTKNAGNSSKVFSVKELQDIADARDIANLTRRSAEAGTTPPATGARTLPFMAGSTAAGTAGAAYMALGMLGDSIDPATRIALAGVAAPMGALSVMKGLNNYARSPLGKNLHFADPKFKGALGAAQEYLVRGARGAGEPIANDYLRGPLGHRE